MYAAMSVKREKYIHTHIKTLQSHNRLIVLTFKKKFCFSKYTNALLVEKLNIWVFLYFLSSAYFTLAMKGILRKKELRSPKFEVRLSAFKFSFHVWVTLWLWARYLTLEALPLKCNIIAPHRLFWGFTMIMTVKDWAQSKPSVNTTYYSHPPPPPWVVRGITDLKLLMQSRHSVNIRALALLFWFLHSTLNDRPQCWQWPPSSRQNSRIIFLDSAPP